MCCADSVMVSALAETSFKECGQPAPLHLEARTNNLSTNLIHKLNLRRKSDVPDEVCGYTVVLGPVKVHGSRFLLNSPRTYNDSIL